MVNQYRSCKHCNEYRKPALRQNQSDICHNCADTKHSIGQCTICRRHNLPIEHHHLAGRKHASMTISICLNCHAMLSRRQYQWPDLWRGNPCIGFLFVGFMDYYALSIDPTMPLEALSDKSQQIAKDATWMAIDTLIFLVRLMPLVLVLMFVLKIMRTSARN